jgi:hypothetical protein
VEFNYTVTTGAANQAFNLTIPDICEATPGKVNGKPLLLFCILALRGLKSQSITVNHCWTCTCACWMACMAPCTSFIMPECGICIQGVLHSSPLGRAYTA